MAIYFARIASLSLAMTLMLSYNYLANKSLITKSRLKNLRDSIRNETDPETKKLLEIILECEEEYLAGKTKVLSPDLHELLED